MNDVVWRGIPEEYRNQIVTGDARELVRRIPDQSVDLVLIDPPYFLPATHYKTRTHIIRSLADLSIIESFFNECVKESIRILRQEGAFITFCDGQSYPIFFVRLYRHFDRIVDVVWNKTKIGMGRGIRRTHEWLIFALPKSFMWNGWESSVINNRPVLSQDRIHPAEKPVDLLRRIINITTKPGDLIVDYYAGSGSLAVAAKLEGRKSVGFEFDPVYAEKARERIQNTQPPLFVPKPEQAKIGF